MEQTLPVETPKPLTTVHEALNNAVFASNPKGKTGVPTSVRLNADLRAEATDICFRNGTSLSEFLRQCVIGLVNDYRDPSRG